jgi:excisionase family DNA binding protein
MIILMIMALTLGRPTTPSQRESELAEASSHILAKHGKRDLKIKLEGKEETLTLPASAVQLLKQALGEIAQGNAVALVALETELSTHEAADLLKVSRPYLIKLLEGGDIPYRKVGSHRRVELKDVLAYKEKSDVERLKALRALVEEAQELNMGY